MKYLLLDGENVNVGGCESCPLASIDIDLTEGQEGYIINCWYNRDVGGIKEFGFLAHDHYLYNCPLSEYQSVHHLYVSAKCIYQTLKTIYNNFKAWWGNEKKQ